MRTLISNGTVVTADGSYSADVLIDGERIAQIGAGLAATARRRRDHRRAGQVRHPGRIDVHTHMELPFGGTFAKDNFETGTRAAAFGGTTSIVDFAVQSRGKSLREGLDAWHALAEGNAVTDYGFHMIMSDVNDDSLAEMDGLVAEGVPGLQAVHGLPGRLLQRRRRDLPGDAADREERRPDHDARRERHGDRRHRGRHGRRRHDGPDRARARPLLRPRGRGHEPGHPARAGREGAGVHRPSLGARGAERRADGARRGPAGVRRDVPAVPVPLAGRPRQRVQRREVRVLAAAAHRRTTSRSSGRASRRTTSRSSRPTTARSTSTARRSSAAATSARSPTACPGVEDRLDLLHDGGVVGGKITKERWVDIVSTAPAKLFGMYPRKGAIAVGSDADIVVYDPARKHTISASTHHMDVDYSCYEGRSVQGGSDVVLSRGSVVVRNGEFTGKKGAGRFIKRATSPTTPGWPDAARQPTSGRPIRPRQRWLKSKSRRSLRGRRRPESARRDAGLGSLADRPVLAADEVPQLDRRGRVEAGRGDRLRPEQELRGDGRPVRPVGLDR